MRTAKLSKRINKYNYGIALFFQRIFTLHYPAKCCFLIRINAIHNFEKKSYFSAENNQIKIKTKVGVETGLIKGLHRNKNNKIIQFIC